MKIYTKGGDKGRTSLVGGERVSKSHPRVEAYGAVDELISCLGLVRASLSDAYYSKFILAVQDKLMICAALLASGDDTAKKLPEILPDDITALETEIDRMDETLPQLNSFVIPGGNLSEAFCHVARSVCRRAEREAVSLAKEHKVSEFVLKYLNRLSDFLFTLARKAEKDAGLNDDLWLPNCSGNQ
jgi:cob(I)alamin adenosyltransferase